MSKTDVRKKIRQMLAEDLGKGDVTSESLFGPNVKSRAKLIANQCGVLAGVREAAMAFEESGVLVRILRHDGDEISTGDVIMCVSGSARSILATERVVLNLLMRMSGIATATRDLIIRAKEKNPNIAIAATRKTAPLISYFDKKAVMVAGGIPHRYSLSDQVLIKDTHLKLTGSIKKAINSIKQLNTKGKIEVEVSNPEEALMAAREGADIVMLDNMAPSEHARAIKMLKREGIREKVILEASGGINLSNVGKYASVGVDVISSSYMTMRAPAIDIGLEIINTGSLDLRRV